MRKLLASSETAVLALLAVSILWRGGKALDVVWLQALVAGVVILFTYSREKESFSVPRFFLIAVLSFVSLTIASFVFSLTGNYGFDEVLQTVSLSLIALWAASEIQKNPRFPLKFSAVISGATLIACGVGVIVYVLQPVNRFTGTFFDYRFHTDYWPNAWAEFLLLAWPILVWTFFLKPFQSKALGNQQTKSLMMGFVFACLFLSYSRGAVIAAIGQIALLFFVAFFHRKHLVFQKVLSSISIIAVTSAIMFAVVNHVRSQFHTIESLGRKVTFTSAEGASSVSERKSFWDQSFTLISTRPLLGFGPYSFRFVQPHLQQDILATSDHPHNVFLKIGSERGVVAGALLLLIVVYTCSIGVFQLLRKHAPTDPVSLRTFFLISVAGVVAHNLIDYNLQFVGIALPFWMMIGMIVSVPQKPKASSAGRYLLLLLSAALLFFSFYEGIQLAISSRARRSEARQQTYEALRWYSWIDSALFPRDARLAQAAMLLNLNQMQQAEAAVSTYLVTNNADGRAWRLLGDIYLKWNKRNDSLRAYEKAYQYGRYNDAGIVRGLIYLLHDVDREMLVKRRSEFDRLINDFGLAVLQNTHFIDLSSNVESLVSVCELMARYFPEDGALYRSLARTSLEHAKSERAKMSSRPPGLLW